MQASNQNQQLSASNQLNLAPSGEQMVRPENLSQQHFNTNMVHKLALTTEVQFIVKCNQTATKDRVAIVGNIPILGEWNPELCNFLETNAKIYPYWHVTVNLPRDYKIEYKYIIVQEQSKMKLDKHVSPLSEGLPIPQYRSPQVITVKWEDLGDDKNRILNTFDKSHIILHEEFNNKKVVEEFIEDTPSVSIFKNNNHESDAQEQQPVNLPKQIVQMPVKQVSQQKHATQSLQQALKTETQASKAEAEITQKKIQMLVSLRLPLDKIRDEDNLQAVKLENVELADIKEENEELVASQRNNIDQNQGQKKLGQKQPVAEVKTPISKKQDQIKQQNQKKWEEDLIVQPKIEIDNSEPIIISSYLLPYEIVRNKQDGSLSIQKCLHNPTMLYATLENMKQKGQFNFHWVGLVITENEFSNEEKEDLTKRFQAKNSYPIFMTHQSMSNFLQFYENILRPLFHNFKDIRDMRNDFLKYWKDYVAVNQRVAQKILEVKNNLTGCKTIWIHNNHLLMVPLYVKKQFEEANIGMFFHSPFPSSAHFRSHKYRFEILKSLLHCDLVAFHLFMFARNFFKSCNRICGFEIEFRRGGFLGINFHGKHVMIRVSHIGIEESFLEELIKSKKFKTFEKKFKDEMKVIGCQLKANILKAEGASSSQNDNEDSLSQQDKKVSNRPIIMASIDDSYHPISGLKNKLLSYQLFLQKYPSYQNRIVLIQFVSANTQLVDDEHFKLTVINNNRKKIFEIQEEIHREFGPQCLIIQESNPSLEKRLALWTSADIILCSSLKDGLCLPILEYVKCKMMAGKLKYSTMISSEFAGCNEGMRGVLVYNPFSATEFLETMDKALSLTPEEREEKMKLAYQYVKRNSVTKWTEEFLKDLKLAYQPVQVSYYLGLNFNANRGGKNINRLMQEKSGLKKLNIDECCGSLLKAQKCVLFLDIESLPHLQFSKHSIPTNEVIEQLHGLLIDNRNTVVIMGSNSREELEDWFGRSVGNNGNNFWLVAESGYLYRPGNKEGWQKLTELHDLSWINQVKKIMQAYTDNIDGSFIEVRQSCIVWNYRNAEMEHGNMFIHDLYSQIEKTIKGTNTEIIYGNGYLEVKPLGIEKTKLINLLLDKISFNSLIDFLFYMGIDSSDEPVFELLKSEKVKEKYLQPSYQSFICSLEKKPSEAEYYIEEIDKVRMLLEKMQTEIKKRKKIRSYSDLTVLRTNQNPFSGKKLQGKKVESIANLQQYFNSQIGLNDKIVFGTDSQISSFIPKRGDKQSKNNYGEYYSTNIIEEESLGSSHQSYGNKINAESKNKYGSVEINPNKLYQESKKGSSNFGKEMIKQKSVKKKSENNADESLKLMVPNSCQQQNELQPKKQKMKSSNPSSMRNLKTSMQGQKNKLLNRSQSPNFEGSGQEDIECLSSDRQENYFVKPPNLISDKKNTQGIYGAIHQSLASFQKRQNLKNNNLGSDMKFNDSNNFQNDDSSMSFKKTNNEPMATYQGSNEVSSGSFKQHSAGLENQIIGKNISLGSIEEKEALASKKISSDSMPENSAVQLQKQDSATLQNVNMQQKDPPQINLNPDLIIVQDQQHPSFKIDLKELVLNQKSIPPAQVSMRQHNPIRQQFINPMPQLQDKTINNSSASGFEKKQETSEKDQQQAKPDNHIRRSSSLSKKEVLSRIEQKKNPLHEDEDDEIDDPELAFMKYDE